MTDVEKGIFDSIDAAQDQWREDREREDAQCPHESVTRLPGITNGGVKISVCRNCGEQLEDHPE